MPQQSFPSESLGVSPVPVFTRELYFQVLQERFEWTLWTDTGLFRASGYPLTVADYYRSLSG